MGEKITKRQRLLKNLCEHTVEEIVRGNSTLGYYQMEKKIRTLEKLQKRFIK